LLKPSSESIAKKIGPPILERAQAGDLYAVYILQDQMHYAATTASKAIWSGFFNQVPAGILAAFWRHPLAGSRKAGIPIAGTTVYPATEAKFRAATLVGAAPMGPVEGVYEPPLSGPPRDRGVMGLALPLILAGAVILMGKKRR
jgi:hypothetical protein